MRLFWYVLSLLKCDIFFLALYLLLQLHLYIAFTPTGFFNINSNILELSVTKAKEYSTVSRYFPGIK